MRFVNLFFEVFKQFIIKRINEVRYFLMIAKFFFCVLVLLVLFRVATEARFSPHLPLKLSGNYLLTLKGGFVLNYSVI